MPRVYTAKAAKDYPSKGIAKGDTYYHWSFFRGPKQMSKTRPRQSQLTGSETLSSAYAAVEEMEDAVSAAGSPQEVMDALQAVVDDSDVVSGFEEKISNLEESFSGGCPQIDETTEQKDNFEQFQTDCQGVIDEIEGLEASYYADEEEDKGKVVKEFDDLGTTGQAAMLEVAKEIANGLSYSS